MKSGAEKMIYKTTFGASFFKRTLRAVCLCLVAGFWWINAATAQPPGENGEDREVTIFRDKQEEMLLLLKRQKNRLAEIEGAIDDNKKEAMRMDEFLKYPRNLKDKRDEAQKEVVAIRKKNDEIFRELEKMHFQWFAYSRHLMAVYTRLGEFKILKKTDEDLNKFLLAYREYIFQVEKMVVRLNDTYNVCDYLLTAKLN